MGTILRLMRFANPSFRLKARDAQTVELRDQFFAVQAHAFELADVLNDSFLIGHTTIGIWWNKREMEKG